MRISPERSWNFLPWGLGTIQRGIFVRQRGPLRVGIMMVSSSLLMKLTMTMIRKIFSAILEILTELISST